MSRVQVLVVSLCAAALFVDGYDIQVMALAAPSLAKAWSLPPSSFGLALSAVLIGISIGSGIIGPLGDRFGRRTMLGARMRWLDADEVGRITVDAIKRGDLYAITHPEQICEVEARHRAIEQAFRDAGSRG